MHPPDDDPELESLLAPLDRDAPAPDHAFLAALRERGTSAFQAAAAPTPRKRIMNSTSFRWLAGLAATLMAGAVLAQWVVRMNRIPIVDPVPEDRFVLNGKLVDDGRLGKVADSQGVVSIKPVMAERWSPVQPQLVLKPGDLLRTEARGANAASLKLLPSTGVIVGPHSLVELVKADQIRLVAGELEVTAGKGAPVQLLGPGKESLKIEGTQFIRIEKEKLVRIEKQPFWLQGFKGSTNNESIGSLVATVDGRNVPLTVGYHHVNVDIRDQIARTVVEESFVNRTDSVLEGVFYFPLPADASISGFGMWIGDQLVEADVVEKQRAREIYETILREKRDPGLLEWAGGNLFKARVYPIPARSEKRIRISYTQVLPMKGNRYRYSYALQSDLLKQHPLRELKIDVKVNSAVPLKGVTSPTHDTRLATTEHSGHVEFAAQEYTPTRDFETVVEVAGRSSDVVVIPHRRGNDGYFMVQLTPPGAAGNWERPLIPNGEPLKLQLIADTSASMDRGQRNVQNALVASILGSLTPKDSINLAMCDVNCDWVFEKPVPATLQNIAAIRAALDKRISLGWTNLDKAFASAFTRSDAGTHTVYLGDGISTNSDADPVAMAQRLNRMYEGKAGTFHAIALGSSYEHGVMKAIAALGGGSFRRVSGEQGPQAVAAELLTEIATPALRNVKLEFRGVRTARVYPEELPNIAVGSQQILLGRYLPDGKDQQGEIVVSGTLAGKPVQYVSKFQLKDAEQGNEFLPRLWARMHLDKLLQQGTSEAIQQEVIALSEEFNIITPYTSLLVLESDADRERFAVKKRFRMSDGEKFFAAGQDNANFELKQKQIRLAGDYRTALRRKVLSQLESLGRDARMFAEQREIRKQFAKNMLSEDHSKWSWDEASPLKRELGLETHQFLEAAGSGSKRQDQEEQVELSLSSVTGAVDSLPRISEPLGETEALDELVLSGKSGLPGLEGSVKLRENQNSFGTDLFALSDWNGLTNRDFVMDGDKAYLSLGESLGRPAEAKGEYYRRQGYHRVSPPLPWLQSYFPALPATPAEVKEPKTDWPAEAIALSNSLLRREKLLAGKGGVAIQRTKEYLNPTGDLRAREERFELASPLGWIARSSSDREPTGIEWCNAKERGVVNTAFQLGRVRASKPNDLAWPALQLNDESMAPLHTTQGRQSAKVEAIAKDRTLLTLQHRRQPEYETRYLIDTVRHVLLSVEHLENGQTTGITKYGNFVEAAGTWWAGLIESFDEKNRKIARVKQSVESVSEEQIRDRMAKGLDETRGTLMLKQPLPGVSEAKAAQNKSTLEDAAVLVLHFAQSQQWAKAKERFATFERLAKDRSPRALQFLKHAFQLASREHETLRIALMDQAKAIAELKNESPANRQFLVESVFGIANQVLAANEQLQLWDLIEKIPLDQPAYLNAHKAWRVSRVNLLQQAGEVENAMEASRKLAVDYPGDSSLQTQYAYRLDQSGRHDTALAWIETALNRKWAAADVYQLKNLAAEFLQQQGRFAEAADYLARWVDQNPEDDLPYSKYLSALVRTNHAAKANMLGALWLHEGIEAKVFTKPMRAKVYAAVSFAMGQSYYYYSNRIDEQWLEPLAETALHFARTKDEFNIAGNILNHWKFQQTDQGKKVMRTLSDELIAGAATMPVEQLQRYWQWGAESGQLKKAEKEKLAAAIRTRWDAEKDAERKDRLAQVLVMVYQHIGTEPWLAFLRVRMQTAGEDYREAYARQLFDALLQQPWKAELENELFALIEKLAQPDDLANQVAVLHRIDDAMIESRYRAAYGLLEHPEKLPRPELVKKQSELRKQARSEYADHLRLETGKHAKPFAQWIALERLWLETLLERDLKSVAADAWAVLDTPVGGTLLEVILRERLILTLTHLAARKDADPVRIEQLVKYCSEPSRKGDLYRLMIALDRPKELEAALRQWIVQAEAANPWKLALGRLLAEQGKLPEAIRLFETVEADDELPPEAYQSLAQWYLAENRREGSELARRAIYRTTEEHRLQQQLNSHLQPWLRSNGNLPSKFEPEVFELFQALFEKSAWPGNYVPMLLQFYQASRDFRFLALLAEGTVGHTAGKVYPFLQAMGRVFEDVGDEATVNQLSERIVEVRKGAKSAIDHRALDLLTVMVERRAAELLNQAGPHGQRARAALEAAFKREWSPGEPVQMARFLAGLGRISEPALAMEQLRELESLHGEAKAGTLDDLNIALQYAIALNAAGKIEPSLEVLESAIRVFKGTHGDRLPTVANPVFEQLVAFTANARQYERGEAYLLAELKNPVHAQQRIWLTRQLNEHYLGALRHKGTVTLGQGATLYKAIEKKMYGEMQSPNQHQRYELVLQMVRLYRTAKELAFDMVTPDLKAFAFEKLPAVLKTQAVNDDDIVREVSRLLHDLLGPQSGIAFLLDRAENLPDWARYQNQDFWNQYSHTLGAWRSRAKDLGELEPRLLKFVLAELRRDLGTRENRNRTIYHRQSSYFWAEKEPEFIKVAEEVLRAKADSSSTIEFVAEYLFFGLSEERRAIEVLQAADAAKRLTVSGRFQLADYLQRKNRFADSIPLLLTLIEGDKDHLTYRIRLMKAYFKTEQAAELAKWLKATDAYFNEKKLWNHSVLAALAESCLENKLAAEAVAYYEELIPAYQRSRPNRGVGDHALNRYYLNAADAYNLLGKTKEAVDRASAAVIVWPAGHRERKETLDRLVDVLVSAQKLDAYIAALDAEPMQSAIVRKAIGQALVKRNQHARAIPQFQLAADLQPNDAELYELMVACSDKAGDKEGAVRQLLAGAENTRRNVSLWSNLGYRLKELGRTAEAERAFTSIVEMLPNESESHTELAEVYGKEKRWPEAIEQWQRVVAIRKLEPTGLLKLANAQIEAKEWNAVPETLRKLRSQHWPSRFSDTEKQISQLEERLKRGKSGSD